MRMIVVGFALVGVVAVAAMACKTGPKSGVSADLGSSPDPVIATGTIDGANKKSLAYQTAKVANAKGSVLFLQGYNQSYLTNAPLIKKLNDQGYSVYALDNRGMGLSERILPDKPQMGYVEDYQLYVQDAQLFLEQVVLKDRPTNLSLLAHSTGGRIALDVLAINPNVFRTAVLNSPAIQINTGVWPSIARWLAGGKILFGLGDTWPDSVGGFNENPDFSKNRTTHSLENFNADLAIRVAHPEMQLGGPSYKWVYEMLKAGDAVSDLAKKIRIPMLMLQAGDDQFVLNPPQDAFCKASPSCRLVRIEGAKHESYNEVPEIQEQMFRELFAQLDQKPAAAKTTGVDRGSQETRDRTAPPDAKPAPRTGGER